VTRPVAEVLKHTGTDKPELLGEGEDLCSSLLDRLLHYRQILRQEGFDLPYVWPVSQEDAAHLTPHEETQTSGSRDPRRRLLAGHSRKP
jgi:hypothetical protein